jgi:hypothetical protein
MTSFEVNADMCMIISLNLQAVAVISAWFHKTWWNWEKNKFKKCKIKIMYDIILPVYFKCIQIVGREASWKMKEREVNIR